MLAQAGGILLGQTPQTPCCEMKIRSAQEDPAHLTVTIKNVERQPVFMGVARPERDFEVRIASIGGRQPDRTVLGKRVQAGQVLSSLGTIELKKGEESTEDLNIGHLFDLMPGLYNVVLTRVVFVEDKPVQLAAAIQVRIPQAQQGH